MGGVSGDTGNDALVCCQPKGSDGSMIYVLEKNGSRWRGKCGEWKQGRRRNWTSADSKEANGNERCSVTIRFSSMWLKAEGNLSLIPRSRDVGSVGRCHGDPMVSQFPRILSFLLCRAQLSARAPQCPTWR